MFTRSQFVRASERSPRYIGYLLILAASFAVGPTTARAQYTWAPTSNQTGIWNVTGRWTGGPAGTFPNAVDATATLNGPLSTAPSGNYNVQLSATAGQSITIGGLTVNNFVGTNDTANLRIGGNGNGTLTFQSSSGPAFYTENAGPGTENTSAGTTLVIAPVTFASDTVITQNHAINNNSGTSFTTGGITAAPGITVTKAGAGNVEFSGAPAGPGTGFQGSLVVNNGAVRETVNVFQNAASVTVNSGGQFQIGSATVTDWNFAPGAVLNLNGNGKATGVNTSGALRDQNATAVTNFDNPVNLQTDSAIDVNGTGVLTLTQTVSGAGSLAKTDSGTLVLGGTSASTYGGATKVQGGTLTLAKPDGVTAVTGNITVQSPTGTNAAVLQLGANNQIADTASVTLLQSSGTGTPNGTFNLNSFQETIGGLNSTAGAGVVQNNGSAGNSTLTVNTTPGASSYSGVIQDGAGTGTLALAVTGSSSLSLSGASTYTGGTTVAVGSTLLVNNTTGSATGTGTVTVDGLIGGNGIITNQVNLGGGTLAPSFGSANPATLTLGSTALVDAQATVDYQLGAPNVVGGGINDLTVVNGDLTLNGTLNVTGLTGFAAGQYELFSYTGSLFNNGFAIGQLPAGFEGFLDFSNPNQVDLDVQAVNTPEPSTFALAACAAGFLVRRLRRRASH